MNNKIPETAPFGPLLGIFHDVPHHFDKGADITISPKYLAEVFRLTEPSDSEYRYFALLKDNEYFCGRITVEKTKKAAIIIKNVDIFSYEQVLVEYEGEDPPESKDAFIRDLSQFPLIEPAIDFDDAKTEEESSASVVEKVFVLGNRLEVTLSEEMLSNVAGKRDSAHYFSTRMIKICAQKKQKKLKDQPLEERVPYYFQASRNPHEVLVMVFLRYLTPSQESKVIALTGYYMANSEIKYYLRFKSDAALKAWKKNLPFVKEN